MPRPEWLECGRCTWFIDGNSGKRGLCVDDPRGIKVDDMEYFCSKWTCRECGASWRSCTSVEMYAEHGVGICY
jgi:hypothetical protein